MTATVRLGSSSKLNLAPIECPDPEVRKDMRQAGSEVRIREDTGNSVFQVWLPVLKVLEDLPQHS